MNHVSYITGMILQVVELFNSPPFFVQRSQEVYSSLCEYDEVNTGYQGTERRQRVEGVDRSGRLVRLVAQERDICIYIYTFMYTLEVQPPLFIGCFV